MDPQPSNLDNQVNSPQSSQPPQPPTPPAPQVPSLPQSSQPPNPAVPPVGPAPTPSAMPASPYNPDPNQPPQPLTNLPYGQTSVVSGTGGNFSAPPKTGKLSPKKLIMIIIGASLIVIIAILVYLFAIYLPNTPNNVFKSSLKNSSKTVKGFTNYLQTTASQEYNATKFDGKINIKSPDISMDGSFDGKVDKKGNGDGTVKLNVMGQKVSADVISVNKDKNLSPDIYFKINGDEVLNQYGLGTVSGKWLKVDHTLVDSAIASGQKEAGIKDAVNTMPTKDEIFDAIDKVNQVNDKYLFSADPETAVIKNDKFIGTEKGINHYAVSIDKAHSGTYKRELGKALDSSKLNDWYKKANSGKNLSEALNDSDSSSDTDQKDVKMDLYINKSSKTIHSLVVSGTNDDGNEEKITLNQTAQGSTSGLSVKATGEDTGNIEMSFSVDPKTNKFDVGMNVDDKGTTVKLDMSATLTNEKVDEQPPAGAIDLSDLMAGSYSSPYGSSLDSSSTLYGGQYNFTR